MSEFDIERMSVMSWVSDLSFISDTSERCE